MKALLKFHPLKSNPDYNRPLYGALSDSVIALEETVKEGMEIVLPPREGKPMTFIVTRIEQTRDTHYEKVVYLTKKMPQNDIPPHIEQWDGSGINYVKAHTQLLLEERMALFGI